MSDSEKILLRSFIDDKTTTVSRQEITTRRLFSYHDYVRDLPVLLTIYTLKKSDRRLVYLFHKSQSTRFAEQNWVDEVHEFLLFNSDGISLLHNLHQVKDYISPNLRERLNNTAQKTK